MKHHLLKIKRIRKGCETLLVPFYESPDWRRWTATKSGIAEYLRDNDREPTDKQRRSA